MSLLGRGNATTSNCQLRVSISLPAYDERGLTAYAVTSASRWTHSVRWSAIVSASQNVLVLTCFEKGSICRSCVLAAFCTCRPQTRDSRKWPSPPERNYRPTHIQRPEADRNRQHGHHYPTRRCDCHWNGACRRLLSCFSVWTETEKLFFFLSCFQITAL
jgi:hypothetical protein